MSAIFPRPALLLPAALVFFAGCQTRSAPSRSSFATLVEFRADSTVRNPAAHDAFPDVRRVVLRAVDGRVRPDRALQVTDRVSLAPGERTLLFAAESSTGRVALSELTLTLAAGTDYVVRPQARPDGTVLAEVSRGPYGEVVGRSSPWTPPKKDQAEGRAP